MAADVVLAGKPPKAEIGAQSQVNGFDGWAAFVDEAEYVPELSFPQSITTYHRQRSDSQVDALHLGTTLPVREFRWSIRPNGAPAAHVEQAAADLGLPIHGHEDDNVPRSAARFDFDQFAADAMLALLYGFFDHEIVGEASAAAGTWRIAKLAPRHPRTIHDFQTTATGDLLAIRQNIGGAVSGWMRMPPPIPANKLVRHVWRAEAGSHVGRSMLRSIYREFLVKDRTIRIAAINLERAGGMPVVEGPAGASDTQLANLAQLARQFKVAEGGGGAIPFGSKLHLVGGNTPDAIKLLEYCDQAMARVWALMLMQLGQTQTGSRALGGEFSSFAAAAQRAIAKWFAATVNRLLDRYTEWNLGPSATHAPMLGYEQTKPDSLATADFVALIEAGALTVDPELEAWLRNEHGFPDKPLDEQGNPVVHNGPPPEQVPPTAPHLTVVPQPAAPPQPAAVAAAGPAAEVFAATMLPDRDLRRQPYEHEVRAAVDFRSLDVAHEAGHAAVESLYLQSVIPSQIESLSASITTTREGTPRQRLTRAAMAGLSAPVEGRDDLVGHLAEAARSGAYAARAELEAQGLDVSGITMPDDDALVALVRDQADAVSTMAANGISLSAQRRAQSLVGGGRTPADVASDVRAHLGGLKHKWTLDQLRGAVTMAQNAGRISVFEQGPRESILFYASELLDANCCGPCTDVDGTEYPDLQAAEQDYAAGGYVNCSGGPNCRGTLVAVYAEQDPVSRNDPFTAGLDR